jgi:PPM family protein phosphatase
MLAPMSVYRASGADLAACISVAACTDAGLVRKHNEDSFLVSDLLQGSSGGPEPVRLAWDTPFCLALGVYDGAGGESSPDAASRLAARTIHAQLSHAAASTSDELSRRLVESLVEANRLAHAQARRVGSHMASYTTATVAALCDERLLIAHVGDGRAYLLRDDALSQVTRDQTLVQALLDEGKISPAEARTFEHRDVVLQPLGAYEHVEVALSALELRRDDVLLLCTDGLSDLLDEPTLLAGLDASDDPAGARDALVAAARRAGGRDNLTALVARFSGAWLAPSASAGHVEIVELSRYSGRPGRRKSTGAVVPRRRA